MIQQRCPWCGELISFDETVLTSHGLNKNIWNCKSCNRLITFRVTFVCILSIFMGILLSLFSLHSFFFIAISFISISYIKSPYIKYEGYTDLSIIRRKKEDVSSEPMNWYTDYYNLKKEGPFIPVYIRWYAFKEGGLWFPRLRIWNGYIFPVCVIDEQDTPASHMYCARITQIKFYEGGIKASLQYLDPEAPLDILKLHKKFYLFNANKKIGVGFIE